MVSKLFLGCTFMLSPNVNFPQSFWSFCFKQNIKAPSSLPMIASKQCELVRHIIDPNLNMSTLIICTI